MYCPQPIVLGVHSSIFVIEFPQEYHLEAMIEQKNVSAVAERMGQVSFISRKNYVVINTNEADVDLK